MKQTLHALVFLFAFQNAGFSQANLTFPVNVLEGIQNGQISVTHPPIDIGAIENAFDGDLSNVARSAAVNPMIVTLQFPFTINLTQTSLYTSNFPEMGNWSVEMANSLSDLNNQTGTYVKLVDHAPYSGQLLSTHTVSAGGKLLRLYMQRTLGDDYVHLSEWGITATATVAVTSVCLRPNQIRLIPNSSFQPKVLGTDAAGNVFPLSSGVSWASSNSGVISVDASGLFTSGNTLGESLVSATWNGLSFSALSKVVADFTMPAAAPRIVKVALVFIDPPIPAAGGQRFSQVHWNSFWGSPANFEQVSGGTPQQLANKVRDSLTALSGGAVTYQFVETHDEPNLLTTFGGSVLTVDSMYHLFQEPGWTTLHLVAETQSTSFFHYNELLDKYDFCAKSNNHQIDEVWVYAMPFIGMWESNMTGTGAFWINGAVITGNACTDLLPIMGLNYERSYDLALHNFGHRIETTLYKTFNERVRYVESDPPFPAGVPKTALQKFMSYDLIEPGDAHVGNVHFPPNAVENYGYYNTGFATTYEQNWKRYPFLFQQTRSISCTDWDCQHEDFMRWWLRHLPHFKCKDQNGRLNNWWAYVVDYNEGKALESQTSNCDCAIFEDVALDCASKGEFPWHDWIAGVKVGAFNNPSGKSQYSDFTNQVIDLAPGTATPVEITVGFSYFTYDEYVRIWIDKDQNDVFDDADKVFEGVLNHPPNGTPTALLTGFGGIFIPYGVPAGQYKMRVSMKRGGFPTPCETIPFGEVEDYTANILVSPLLKPDLSTIAWEVIPANANCYTNPAQPLGFLGGLVINLGPGAAGSFNAKAFLSKDNQISDNDLLWQTLNYPSLTANGGANYTAGLTINAPVPAAAAPGTYFGIVKVDSDDTVAESDENNNIFSASMQIGAPDFVVQNIGGVPANVQPGGSLNVSFQVNNVAVFPLNELSGGFTANVYLSTDNQLQPGTDVVIGTANLTFSQFNASGVATASVLANIPAGTAAGNYFLILRENAGCELNFQNNVSAAVALQIGGTPGQYCQSKGNFPWEDWIGRVKLNDLDHASGKSQYSNFTGITTNVTAGTPYPITLQTGYSYFTFDEYWKVWIDYNQNGTFEEPDETVVSAVLNHPPDGTFFAALNTTAFIKGGFSTGFTTRMRVAMKRGSYPAPCETFGFGEVEDYSIHITPGINPGTYCASASNFPWEDWIGGVKIGATEKISGKSSYSDFTGTTFTAVRGTTTSVELTAAYSWASYDEYWKIWVDFSQDGTFFGGGEEILSQILTRPPDGTLSKTIIANIFVPSGVPLGPARMRVSMKRGAYAHACETIPFGEVEDYTINIVSSLLAGDAHASGELTALDISLFPNPADDHLNIRFPEEMLGENIGVKLFNQLGVPVLEQQFRDMADPLQTLDLSGVSNGSYVVKIEMPGQRPVYKKLVLSKL